jgi:hypothetical protein
MAEHWDERREIQDLVRHEPELFRLYGALGYNPDQEKRVREILVRIEDLLNKEKHGQSINKELHDHLSALKDDFQNHAPQSEPIKQKLIASIDYFEQTVKTDPTKVSLTDLKETVERIVSREGQDNWTLNWQRQELDEFLRNLLNARRQFLDILYPANRAYYSRHYGQIDRWQFSELQQLVLDESRRYLRNQWMQNYSTGRYLLWTLFQQELIRLTGVWEDAESSFPWLTKARMAWASLSAAGGFAYFAKYLPASLLSIAGVIYIANGLKQSWINRSLTILRQSLDEVACNHFDSDELMRRLRDLEHRGILITSIVFSVLKRQPSFESSAPDSVKALSQPT